MRRRLRWRLDRNAKLCQGTLVKHIFGLLISISACSSSAAAAAPDTSILRIVGRWCESVLDPAGRREREAFERAAFEILKSERISVEQAAFIGRSILRYPEPYLVAYRANHTSQLTKLMQDPKLLAAFLGANPMNALFSNDMISVTEFVKPDAYRAVMAEALVRVVTAPTKDLARAFPKLDVVTAQGQALVVAGWLGLRNPKLTAASLGFLSLRWSTDRRLRFAAKFDDMMLNEPYSLRASGAARRVAEALRNRELTGHQIEGLIAVARDPGHPFTFASWTALDAPDALNEDQLAHLRLAWRSPRFPASDRRVLRHYARDLVARIEAP